VVSLLEVALAARQAGLSVVPPREDGSKAPVGEWKAYQRRQPTEAELRAWYAGGRAGIGLVCGAVSGGLECLEFETEDVYQAFCDAATAAGLGPLVERVESGYLELSPGGGAHWLYRCPEIAGNTRLAREPGPEPGTVKVLIETRGEGGYVVVAPSAGPVHPSGRPYVRLKGDLPTIATITPAERAELHRFARTFDRMPPPAPAASTRAHDQAADLVGGRPGDDYERRASFAELLEPRGWKLLYRRGDVEHWQRPDKPGPGISATIGHVRGSDGSPRLWVFSTSTVFESERAYSKFAAYALLEHDSDHQAAAREVYARGYGDHLEHEEGRCARADCPNQQCADCGHWSPRIAEHRRRHEPPEDGWEWPAEEPAGQQEHRAPGDNAAGVIQEPAVELHAFLAGDEPDQDWLIPDLIERGDRVVFTGLEGGGKTTLLRQVTVQTAAGIHPFTLEPIPPLQVLYVDLENSRRQDRRQFRPLVIKAGQALATGQVHLVIQPTGIDLLHQADADWLAARIEATKPDLLCIGPMYKLANGDPIKEEVAKGVVVTLDRLRDTYRLTLLIEAHVPYGNSGGKRPERPYGASIWSRWPEFGIYLDPSGALRHWRGARDERAWPVALRRGGEWPWTVEESATDAAWKAIISWVYAHGRTGSVRELAGELRISKSTVHRALGEHQAWWAKLEQGTDLKDGNGP